MNNCAQLPLARLNAFNTRRRLFAEAPLSLPLLSLLLLPLLTALLTALLVLLLLLRRVCIKIANCLIAFLLQFAEPLAGIKNYTQFQFAK